MTDTPDIKDVVAMLAERIDSLVPELFPAARREGGDWLIGSIEGEKGQSLRICRRPEKAGWWKDFAGYDSGDAFDLVARARCGGDRKEAWRWTLAWLGLSDADPETFRRRAAEAHRKQKTAEERRLRELEKNRGRARAIWLGGEAVTRGGPVDLYLRGRGIGLDVLGRAPGALRFNRQVWCSEVEKKLPAMVATIQQPLGGFLAVHRTWLEPDGADGWRKAGLRDPRKSWPSFAGGLIPLWRGETGLSLKDACARRMPETLCLTEGIEDALTNAMAKPEWRHAAAVSLNNLGNLVLPRHIEALVICRDNDWGKPGCERQFDAAVERFQRAGQSVRVVSSPVGKDMNDLLRGAAE